MKKLGFCACLLAMGGIGAMGTNACSSSSSSGSGSSSGVDEASAEGGSDSGGTGDSSGSSGSSSGTSFDAGSSSGGDAATCNPAGPGGDAAFSCPASGDGGDSGMGPPPPSVGSMGCDLCIESCCSDPYCTCAGDSPATDAGTAGGCLGYFACVMHCIATPGDSGADAGTFPLCDAQCAPAYTPQQVTEGRAILTCISLSCGTKATCAQ